MVIGLNTFSDFFKDFPDSYLIIGGTACDIIIEDAGFTPRATDDIDIILLIEALSPGFVARFWEFIKEGKYELQQKGEQKRNFYRGDSRAGLRPRKEGDALNKGWTATVG